MDLTPDRLERIQGNVPPEPDEGQDWVNPHDPAIDLHVRRIWNWLNQNDNITPGKITALLLVADELRR